jgi:PTH1 family peptidyl-tRNA hydrolase
MYLIAGLGNPGAKYFSTRHNIGFRVIDALAEYFTIDKFIHEEHFLAAKADYKDNVVILMKPLTYMNLSGIAIKGFYDRFEIPITSLDKLLVIYDDVNIDFGTIRLRPSGSDGGQNGIKSVIYKMQSEDIPRLRIGINKQTELEKIKAEGGSLADYVLSEFNDEETKALGKVTEACRDAVLCFIEKGIKESMNTYNGSVFDIDKQENDNPN